MGLYERLYARIDSLGNLEIHGLNRAQFNSFPGCGEIEIVHGCWTKGLRIENDDYTLVLAFFTEEAPSQADRGTGSA